MVGLEKADVEDASLFATMEQAADTRPFIIPASRADHERNLSAPGLVHLRIADRGLVAGFLILALDADCRSVELRRIVVAPKGRGIGQSAIARAEGFCRERLGRTRIWLDVFERNDRARHIYEKLGYRKYGEADGAAGRLWLYDKEI
jgi:ribosomal protein S18 acetylase RimI-like enzyme